MMEMSQLLDPPTGNRLWLKLESLQVTGSFKARGAMNRLLTSDPKTLAQGIVTASGGNHGLAVARAGKIAVEPTGSPTLHASLAAGKVVRLTKVTTRVATMACGRTNEAVYEMIAKAVESVVLVEDEAMLAASQWLWFELGIAADLSAAAAIAALRSGQITLRGGGKVCQLICGAGDDRVL